MREEWGKGRGLPKSAWHRQCCKTAPISAPGIPSILGLFTKPHPQMSRGKNKHHYVSPAGSTKFPLIRALHELFSFGEMWQKDSGTKDVQNNGCFYFPANWEPKIYCGDGGSPALPMDSPHLRRLRVVPLCVGMAWGCHECLVVDTSIVPSVPPCEQPVPVHCASPCFLHALLPNK